MGRTLMQLKCAGAKTMQRNLLNDFLFVSAVFGTRAYLAEIPDALRGTMMPLGMRRGGVRSLRHRWSAGVAIQSTAALCSAEMAVRGQAVGLV